MEILSDKIGDSYLILYGMPSGITGYVHWIYIYVYRNPEIEYRTQKLAGCRAKLVSTTKLPMFCEYTNNHLE